jgi:hypothetical protein
MTFTLAIPRLHSRTNSSAILWLLGYYALALSIVLKLQTSKTYIKTLNLLQKNPRFQMPHKLGFIQRTLVMW